MEVPCVVHGRLHWLEADADSRVLLHTATELPNLLPGRIILKEYEVVGRIEAIIVDFIFVLYQTRKGPCGFNHQMDMPTSVANLALLQNLCISQCPAVMAG